MAISNERWIEQWSRIRERGIWRFIVLYGLLMYGLSFAALMELLDMTFSGQSFEARSFFIRFIVGGLVFGALSWHLSERRYRNHQRTNA